MRIDNLNNLSSKKQTLLLLVASACLAYLNSLAGAALVFALLLLPFAAVLAVRISTCFVILFILFSYFRLHEAFPVLMPFKIPKLLALASLVGIAWHLFITRKLTPYWHKGHLYFLLLFIWLTVCVFMASNRALAMNYWSGTLTKVFLMVFVISWWIDSKKLFNWTRLGIMLSGFSVACVAIYNKLNGIGIIEGSRVTISRDIRAQIGDPNDLSLVLLFPVSFLAAELFNRNNSKAFRLLALIGLIGVVWGIVATQSRGGLLGVLAILGYFTMKRIKNPIVLLGLGFSALLLLMMAAGISDRQSGGAAEEGVDESAMGRIYAWQAAFNMALANPLTGVGIDNFFVNYFFYSPHWDGKNHAVHSTWFQVLAETGFAGLCLFILLMLAIYRSLKRSAQMCQLQHNRALEINANALMAGLIGFVVSGTFLTQAFTWPIYIILSLTLALEHMLLLRGKHHKTPS